MVSRFHPLQRWGWLEGYNHRSWSRMRFRKLPTSGEAFVTAVPGHRLRFASSKSFNGGELNVCCGSSHPSGYRSGCRSSPPSQSTLTQNVGCFPRSVLYAQPWAYTDVRPLYFDLLSYYADISPNTLHHDGTKTKGETRNRPPSAALWIPARPTFTVKPAGLRFGTGCRPMDGRHRITCQRKRR
jgi:hypothetical protein